MAARRVIVCLLLGAAVLAGSAVAGLIIAKRLNSGEWEPPTGDDLVWVKDAVKTTLGARQPPRVIYLHRSGIELRGGINASHHDRSTIVGDTEREAVVVPAFSGSQKRWRDVTRCVRRLFAPFDVTIVEQRPAAPGYILVAVGGKSQLIPSGDKHDHSGAVGGLAPFNGKVIHDAVVFAFSGTLRNQVKPICETIGMEVAHAYGLDHAYDCHDVMTYRRGCKKSFLDKDVPCGETKPRVCHGGSKTQNSYRHLLGLLGPRKNTDPGERKR